MPPGLGWLVEICSTGVQSRASKKGDRRRCRHIGRVLRPNFASLTFRPISPKRGGRMRDPPASCKPCNRWPLRSARRQLIKVKQCENGNVWCAAGFTTRPRATRSLALHPAPPGKTFPMTGCARTAAWARKSLKWCRSADPLRRVLRPVFGAILSDQLSQISPHPLCFRSPPSQEQRAARPP